MIIKGNNNTYTYILITITIILCLLIILKGISLFNYHNNLNYNDNGLNIIQDTCYTSDSSDSFDPFDPLSSSYKDFISQAVFPDVEKIYDDYCIDKNQIILDFSRYSIFLGSLVNLSCSL